MCNRATLHCASAPSTCAVDSDHSIDRCAASLSSERSVVRTGHRWHHTTRRPGERRGSARPATPWRTPPRAPGRGVPEGPPREGVRGASPGGARECTFRRVFNNSPSRDRFFVSVFPFLHPGGVPGKSGFFPAGGARARARAHPPARHPLPGPPDITGRRPLTAVRRMHFATKLRVSRISARCSCSSLRHRVHAATG